MENYFRQRKQQLWITYVVMILLIIVTGIFSAFSHASSGNLGEWIKQVLHQASKQFVMQCMMLVCVNVFMAGVYLGMRSSYKQCMKQYHKMPKEEQRQMDAQVGEFISLGRVIYTRNYFVCRDSRRFGFPYIHAYREVVWAYQAQIIFEAPENIPLKVPIYLKTDSPRIVFQVADGRKHSIATSDTHEFEEHLLESTVIGYGKEQKRRAKERLRWVEDYDPSLVKIRRSDRRKFICIASALVLIFVAAIYVLIRFFD